MSEGNADCDCLPGEQTIGWEGRHGRIYCECGMPMVEGPKAEDVDAENPV